MQTPIKRTAMDIPTTVPVTGKFPGDSFGFSSKKDKTLKT